MTDEPSGMVRFRNRRTLPDMIKKPLLAVAIVLGVQGVLPLTAATWVNVTGNLANMASECGNLTMVSAVPNSNTIIAGVALDGLWANTTGTTWSQMGTGAGSDSI